MLGAEPERTLRVCEIYATILGESTHAGWPGVIVRLVGCPLNCVWCDTTYAREGGEELKLSQVLARIEKFRLPLVELTGGEPLYQPATRPLVSMLLDRGHRVVIETGGSVPILGVDPRACIVLDVKCPGSGAGGRQVWDNLHHLRPGDEIKFVLASRADYEWARGVLARTGVAQRHVVNFSPVEGPGGLAKPELAKWIVDDRLPVRLNLQLHVWIWGAGVRGV
jgi:7-carboxy-7-deazaguanine synthase